jgi:hypothetical protein
MADPSLREIMAALAPFIDTDPEVAEYYASLSQQADANPLTMWEPAVSPRDGRNRQAEFLSAKEPFKLYAGGNGAGKSNVGTVDDLIQLCDEKAVPSHLKRFKRWEPPVPMRVVVPKMNVIEGATLEAFRHLTPRSQLVGDSFDKAYSQQSRKLRFKNGSYVLFNTGDQDRDAHSAVELRRVRFDEEPEGEHGRGIFTENVARLRSFLPEAQISFTMTPLFGLSWVYDTIWERREDPDVFCVVASMRDNPHINADATIKALGHLSEGERQAVVEGLFIHISGTVVSLTDEHLIDPVSPDFLRDKTVYVGLDHGIRRAGVVWVAFDRHNEMVVFDEFYPESATVPAIAAEIKDRNQAWGIKRPLYVGDPSGVGRGMETGNSIEDAFLEQGIPLMRGNNNRRAGILQLRARLESKGLFVTRNCTNLRWEAGRWLVATDEIIAEGKAKVKGAEGSFATVGPDHLWDPTRYIAQERLWYRMPSTVERYREWSPASGTTPPKSLLLARPVRDAGPIGTY